MLARYKALKIGLILAGGAFVQQVVALELGELVLESALSEPLNAAIELSDVAGLAAAQISVSLGTEQDFANTGTELTPLASQVQFAVEVEGGTGHIHLTTENIIEEPFLDLVLNVSWPGGTTQADYTLLLNLPGTATTSADAIATPGSIDTSRSPEAASPPATAEANSAHNDSATGASNDAQTYSVANGDSMWEIAARTRPSSDVSVHQMMLAIQRANQDAFINNNINRVLSGKVLRIPTLEEINLVDQTSAIAQVNQQNQELGTQPLAVNRSAGNSNAAPEQDQLTVLTDDQNDAESSGNGDLDATVAALENEMMLGEESLDRARLENTELTSRFKMLQEEMDLLQNLIVVGDARIAQLQADLASQAETAEKALVSTEEATNVLAAQPAASEPGIVGNMSGWLQNTAVLMGVVLGLLLIVLAYLFWQRRRMSAAVYAFDSGIPELETAENSTFAPAKKTGGGFLGWFAGLGNKSRKIDKDEELVAAAEKTADARGINLRDTVIGTGDLEVDAELGRSLEENRYLDEEQMINAANEANSDLEAVSDQFSRNAYSTSTSRQNDASPQTTRTFTTTEVDDADLADTLIAEAKGFTGDTDEASASMRVFSVAEPSEAEKEAHALAELVTSELKPADSIVPESFDFALKAEPEAATEQTSIEVMDDRESFDFQLSEPRASEDEAASAGSEAEEVALSDEEIQLGSLQLDEEDGDFQSGAPMDECDTKLDLAVAYEAMGDLEGALDILNEVIGDGDSEQVAEANRLKGLWQNS